MSEQKLTVFLIYDTREALDIVREVLYPCFKTIYQIQMSSERSQMELMRMIKREHYAILYVYACTYPQETLEFNQLILQQLGRETFSDTPSESILICDKAQRSDAYALCKNELFYNYETMRPIYDIDKVRLTVNRVSQYTITRADLHYKSLESQSMMQEINKSNDELDKLLGYLREQKKESSKKLKRMHQPGQSLQDAPLNERWLEPLQNFLQTLPEEGKEEINNLLLNRHLNSELTSFAKHNSSMFKQVSNDIESAKPRLTPNKFTHPTVVVADDQRVMLKIIRSILEKRGFVVEMTENGQDTLTRCRSVMPQIILLDIDMPVMNGFEALNQLKQDEKLKHIPVIMLTSFSNKNIFKKCIDAGAVDYIVKPTNAEILIKKIRHALEI